MFKLKVHFDRKSQLKYIVVFLQLHNFPVPGDDMRCYRESSEEGEGRRDRGGRQAGCAALIAGENLPLIGPF